MDNLFIGTGTVTTGYGTDIVYNSGLTTPLSGYIGRTTEIVNYSVAENTIKVGDLMVKSETKTHFVWKRVMPGVKAADLNAFVRNGSLIVELDLSEEYPFKTVTPKEISLNVDNEDYNQDDIELDLTDGILTILIAKSIADKQLTVK